MTRSLLALAVLAALAAPAAADHVVSPQAAEQQLLAAESARARDVAAVDAFVASADGRAALRTLGMDSRAVRGALSRLSDAELAELAARAASLQRDPVAGVDREVIWISAIALAAIILIILIA